MKKKFIIRILVLCIFIFACGWHCAYAREYKWFRAIIGVNSNISAGEYSIETLAKMAKEKDLQIIILTDHLLARAEYGLFPLRRIFKKVKEEKSILKFGISNYLNLIKKENTSYPGVLIIPGCDLAPFYYYTGSPFTENLVVHNFSKQMLVLGFREPEDFKNLPIIANIYRNKKWGLFSLILLWPVAIIFLGIYFLSKRSFYYKDDYGKRLGPYSLGYRALGIVIIIIGTLFFINNFPFNLPGEFDPYRGDKGLAPYQRVINYVLAKGGLVFWSTPEAIVPEQRIRYVKLITEHNPDDLLNTVNYTGFAAIYGDVRTAHEIGRQWDEILKQYCQGKRTKPAWAIGEADYHAGNIPVDAIQTVLLMPNLTEEAVFDALRNGRMYALVKPDNIKLELERFLIEDPDTGKTAYMGEELVAQSIEIKIKISHVRPQPAPMKIRLIKNGDIFKTIETKEEIFDGKIEESISRDKKSYYRLIIEVPGGQIVSNPIFVKARE